MPPNPLQLAARRAAPQLNRAAGAVLHPARPFSASQWRRMADDGGNNDSSSKAPPSSTTAARPPRSPGRVRVDAAVAELGAMSGGRGGGRASSSSNGSSTTIPNNNNAGGDRAAKGPRLMDFSQVNVSRLRSLRGGAGGEGSRGGGGGIGLRRGGGVGRRPALGAAGGDERGGGVRGTRGRGGGGGRGGRARRVEKGDREQAAGEERYGDSYVPADDERAWLDDIAAKQQGIPHDFNPSLPLDDLAPWAPAVPSEVYGPIKVVGDATTTRAAAAPTDGNDDDVTRTATMVRELVARGSGGVPYEPRIVETPLKFFAMADRGERVFFQSDAEREYVVDAAKKRFGEAVAREKYSFDQDGDALAEDRAEIEELAIEGRYEPTTFVDAAVVAKAARMVARSGGGGGGGGGAAAKQEDLLKRTLETVQNYTSREWSWKDEKREVLEAKITQLLGGGKGDREAKEAPKA